MDDDKNVDDYASFGSFWGWFDTLAQLANEDITKIETIINYPLVFVLNYLAYTKDLNDMRARRQREMEMKLKMKHR